MAWLVVITGVCGSGKSTVGRALAEKEKSEFVDGDHYHSSENVRKMSSGQPLTDQDRAPWLATLHRVLCGLAEKHGHSQREGEMQVCGIMACSGLKRSYRDILTGRGLGHGDVSGRCVTVQLTTSVAVLEGRVAGRTNHFMPTSLISSQLSVLEPLEQGEWPCLTCQATDCVDSVVESIRQFISLQCHDIHMN